ncbi:MAG: hypothetical protein D6712_11750 [Chloroflexi bacterium]|nr:MAG: hypothetical protein D6712_11750 [Chloroflexota bacterium]
MSSERTGRTILSALLIVMIPFFVVNYFAGGRDAIWLLLLFIVSINAWLAWKTYKPKKAASKAEPPKP